MKSQEVEAYVLCSSDQNVLSEISDEHFFSSQTEAEEWIKKEDPKDEFAWDIYSVSVRVVKSL